ncbi:MAG: DUF541 domain-containing protein [Proteobacteria bacterium]|nr:DUF541 domain-containing protein [Pseudomonadota bacterium]NIS70557.1 DUF541 domain-containing protein [Pseudomonadota bacterium]
MHKRQIIVLGVILALMTSFSIVCADEETKISTLEVVGHAKIMAKPNTATLSFAVETSAKNAQEAVQENAKQTEMLLEVLRRTLAKEDRLNTSGYSVSPVYQKENRMRVAGYRVTNTVMVETKHFAGLGALIDEAANAGANRMGGLRFSHDREEELRAQAAVEAVHQGMRTAEKLAKAAGVTIKRMLKMSYSPRERIFPMAEARALQAPSPRTPIEIGEIPIDSSVTIVFEVN